MPAVTRSRLLADVRGLTAFAVDWIERRFG